MKKRILAVSLLVSAVSLGVGMSLLFQGQKPLKAEASNYSVNSVPTTIDLNDTSASSIRSYYSSLNSLSTSERQGTNLLKNLKPILKNGQTYFSYGSGATTAVWQAYEIVDRDWIKSPASAISGYNSSTNIITGYTYGKSNTNVGSNPYIHALYVNRNVENETQAWGNHNQNQWGINQEHVWPKSCGFDEQTPAAGARGDLLHLWAGNGRVNGDTHSNYYYGYVDTSKSYNDAGSYASTLSGNKRGTSKTLGGSTTVFEPQDSDKGDIARAIFYMAARYNYISGSDSDGIDAGNPNLEIVNNITSWSNSGYTSSTSTTGKMGILQDLLEWNRLDPPDEWEIHRNNLCYNNFTNNRNPFIDFPEWAEYIWGKSTNGSYNSSSTGYATPSSDSINTFGGSSATVSVTGVSLNKNSTSIAKGSTETLVATVSPSNATNQAVTWTSNNTSVATVSSSGVVTAVEEGNATITVTTVDGSKTATCTVTVTSSGGGSATSGDASLFSGSIEEGDYVIYYSGKAMKNTVSSNRLDYVEVTPTNDVISQPDSSIVWHIAQSGSYWTIYNSSVGKYAAGTTTKNQGTLLDSVTDYAKWTVSGNSTYEFENYGRAHGASDTSSKYLRENTTYGFACYASTGGALSLFKVNSGSSTPKSISATVSKTFKVGETITKSDITVKDDLNNVITDYTFANNNYQFLYSDASSGGYSTNKTFTNAISYNEMTCDLTVSVHRDSYSKPEEDTKTYTGSNFSSLPSSYTEGYEVTVDGITFIIDGYYYSKYSYLSLSNGKTSAPGSIKNDNKYSTGITNVEITGASPNIQLSVNGSTWVDLDLATPETVNYFYFKAFYKSTTQSNYVNISEITVTLKGSETALNVANYIMYEDTNNQCESKFDVAQELFENMTTSERATFMTSSDYVIATARERLQAWATNQGKAIVYADGDYSFNALGNNVIHLLDVKNSSFIIVVLISSITLTTISFVYFFTYKKKRKR